MSTCEPLNYEQIHYNYLVFLLLTLNRHLRDVFRTLSNICDAAFCGNGF